MPKAALVLSGGGAKGAFQVMAEQYARKEKGYQWDVIAGVSAGALNGSMLAMEAYDRLESVWRNISNDQVYTGGLNFWSLVKVVFGAKSIYGNDPLWELINREIDPSRMKIDLRIGAVSLRTGEYTIFRPADPNFKKGLLSSTAIPIIWSPLDISPAQQSMVDGGVRNISPLGDVLDSEPEEIVIINCNPRQPGQYGEPLGNVLEIGKRTIDVVMNELLVTDIREFIRINKNVAEVGEANVTLHNEDGKAFKAYKYHLIEPDEALGDTMDFSSTSIEMRMAAGWDKAKEVLG
jgi:NTE family protein